MNNKEHLLFMPLFERIDSMLTKGSVRLAVEGGSAGGKTTLSRLLAQRYDCTLFHMDDFFLRPEQRTAERLAEPGGNVDRERFLNEVLIPLSKNETVYYRRFDCGTLSLLPPVPLKPKKLTVTEGVYSMHPQLAEYHNLSVFLDIDPELQTERIMKRNSPELAKRFFSEWIPLEQAYFEKLGIPQRCDLIIKIPEENSSLYNHKKY